MLNLRRLDLNLLVTLDALLEEHNVTRAAARLHLSQPSVSVHLTKLRDIFNDPLLLPGPRGMRPTARADALRAPLREALGALEQAIAPASPFDPLTAEQTWRIAASDHSESIILLPLLAALRDSAPGTRLAVLDKPPGALTKQAEQGEIDLAFHVSDADLPGLRRRPLFDERYVLAGRAGHPALQAIPTLEQFCMLEHAIVSPEGGGFLASTDAALAARGLARRVVLSVPHFLFVLSAIAESDVVAMLPSRLVRNRPSLSVVEAPLEVEGYGMSMYWPERVHRDPAHQWLREFIASRV